MVGWLNVYTRIVEIMALNTVELKVATTSLDALKYGTVVAPKNGSARPTRNPGVRHSFR